LLALLGLRASLALRTPQTISFETDVAPRRQFYPIESSQTTRRPQRANVAPMAKQTDEPLVAILMGSKNDWESMKPAADALEKLGIASDVRVISAHRTPQRHHDYVTGAAERGIRIFICGAGFAAHLAGVTAALTPLPVLGVPLDSSALDGMDALLATVQMPGGIPVATFGIGRAGAKNAGLFAGAILAGSDDSVRKKLDAFRAEQTAGVPETPF